nr:rep protein [Cressdnaviricota sp.]
MRKTNEVSELKYSQWVFTWNAIIVDNTKLQILWPRSYLNDFLAANSTLYYFQEERGEETGRRHYQGCFKTMTRVRHSTLLNMFRKALVDTHTRHDNSVLDLDEIDEYIKQLTIDRVRGSWEQAVLYVTKKETRVSDTYTNTYVGNDLKVLEGELHPWQMEATNFFFNKDMTFKPADDRHLYWIEDQKGCSGKSKLVKYWAYRNQKDVAKISFGTSFQLRAGLCSVGPRKLYVVDIPRTTSKLESLDDVLSCLEDLKNGYVVSFMYGKYQELMIEPPHIIVFSNISCPVEKMSQDRWLDYEIYKDRENEFKLTLKRSGDPY